MTGNEKDNEDELAHLRAQRDDLQRRNTELVKQVRTARELHSALLVTVDKRFAELHADARKQYDRAEKAQAALAAAREEIARVTRDLAASRAEARTLQEALERAADRACAALYPAASAGAGAERRCDCGRVPLPVNKLEVCVNDDSHGERACYSAAGGRIPFPPPGAPREEPCLCAFASPGATRESMAEPGPQHDPRCAKHRPALEPQP